MRAAYPLILDVMVEWRRTEETWPTQEEEASIHSRLCDGDPIAPSDLAVAYLHVLAGWLVSRHPGVDLSLCETAAEDAIISVIKGPKRYRPERGELGAYLRMSASGDLKNALRSEGRRRSRQARLEVVELSPELRNRLHDGDADPARIVEMYEAVRERARETAVPEHVAAALSSRDASVLELMRMRERSTAIYAANWESSTSRSKSSAARSNGQKTG